MEPTQEDLKQLENIVLALDLYLKRAYTGENGCVVFTFVQEFNLNSRLVNILAQLYRDAGWKVENKFESMSNLVFTS